MSETFRLTVAVRKRSDLDTPATLDEAIALVSNLLNQGSFVEVLSVIPEQTGKDNQVRWG